MFGLDHDIPNVTDNPKKHQALVIDVYPRIALLMHVTMDDILFLLGNIGLTHFLMKHREQLQSGKNLF